MRSSPTLSETRFSLSFFLTTPAKKPRTECCCHSVAFTIAAMVVPCRSIPSTVSCLDEAPVDLPEAAFGVFTLDEPSGRAELRFPLEDGVVCDCLVVRFADFGLRLLVPIWISLLSTTASCAATDTSPAIARGGRRTEKVYARDSAASLRREWISLRQTFIASLLTVLFMHLP